MITRPRIGGGVLESEARARGDWLGASCVPRWRDEGMLFAADIVDGSVVLSGVGGKVEAGERFAQAARREFREETGVDLPGFTATGRCVPLTAEAGAGAAGCDAAALIAEHVPAHPTRGLLWIAVYVAATWQPPRAVEKVRHFAIVPPAALGLPLDDLTPDALRLVDGHGAVHPLPRHVTRVTAQHTARYVLRHTELLSSWWEIASAAVADD